MSRSRLALLSSVLMAAGCATVAPTIVRSHPSLSLEFAGAEDIEPAVAEHCQRTLGAALTRHGFVVGAEGIPLRVHVAFWNQPFLNGSSGSSVSADFTGTARTLREGETVLASATASGATFGGGVVWPGTPARLAACSYGSERFAEAFAARYVRR